MPEPSFFAEVKKQWLGYLCGVHWRASTDSNDNIWLEGQQFLETLL